MAMRPTAARVRETLLNLIGPAVTGARFLDLCAGCGAVGIEALSRGAAEAWFVDIHRTSISLVRRNLASLEFEGSAVVLRRHAVKAVEELAREGKVFDLAFLDPPYDSDLALRCLRSPGWRAIIPTRGRVFVEHRSDLAWPPLTGLRIEDRRRFGETTLTVFRGEPQE